MTQAYDREELIIAAVTFWNKPLGDELRLLIEQRRSAYYYLRRDLAHLEEKERE